MENKHAYTIAEVSRITGSSRTTIYAEIAGKRLAARKLGRRTLVLAEDLRRWLAALPSFNSEVA